MNVERLTKCGYQFSLLNVLQGLTRYTEIDEILNQLAAYEDTGLSPADIADLTARAEAAEAERDACKADLKSMADWYRDSVCDDGICGWCKQDADHGLDGDANECAGFYKNDCFEWRGQQAVKGGPK